MASTTANGQVNGVAHSAFLDHLLRYPVVSDGVTTVRENKLGQQGLSLSNSAYETFARPVLPYFARPYGYVSPYVKRVDDMGDKTLTRIDETFPVVTKPTAEVYEDTKGIVLLPYRKGMEGKEHFFKVYSSERKNLGGGGYVTSGKALAVALLIVATETLSWARAKLAETKQTVQEETATN